MKPDHNIPIIFAQEGPLKGQNWNLKKEVIIGRDVSCDVSISDRQVSRFHARFEQSGKNQFSIVDNGSKNGTYLNGDRISGSHTLEDGDVVKIALIQELVFFSSDATLPLDTIKNLTKGKLQKLFIDEQARRVGIEEKELLPPLSVSQYKLLTLLYTSENTVISREEVVKHVWGENEAVGVSEQALDALVRRLRKRLYNFDPTHKYLTTVRGIGFIFHNDTYED